MGDQIREERTANLLDRIPDRDEIRERLKQNQRERSILRQLLRIWDQRRKAQENAS